MRSARSSPAPKPAAAEWPDEPDQPDEPDGRLGTPWRRWAQLAAVLAAGAVVGVVGANARHDAVDSAHVELAAGTVELSSADLDGTPQDAAVTMINLGIRPVDIVGVDVDGFSAPASTEPGTPVTAEPGRWVRVPTTVVADCGNRPSGAIRARVRNDAGEQTTDVTVATGGSPLTAAWESACRTSLAAGLFVGDGRVLAANDATTQFALPITNRTKDVLQIVAVESATPGFAVSALELPMEIDAGDASAIRLTWTVDDCVPTTELAEAALTFTVVEPERESLVAEVLGDDVLVELAKLAVRACES